jgi:hypothetical protein
MIVADTLIVRAVSRFDFIIMALMVYRKCPYLIIAIIALMVNHGIWYDK